MSAAAGADESTTMHIAAEITDISWLGAALQAGLTLLLLVLAAAFSGSEAVLFSLNPVQAEQAAASNHPLRRAAASLLRDPRKTLMVILLGNSAVNTFLASNSSVYFRSLEPHIGPWANYIGGALIVLLLIALGETVPKILGVTHAERLAPIAALFVRTVSVVGRPAAWLLDVLMIEPLTRVLFGRRRLADEDEPHSVSGDELKVLLEMSRRGGVIDHIEDAYLREVIDLREIRARDVMIPRIEVAAFDIHGSPDELRKKIRATRHTKVPVYEGSIDNIVGLVYAKVLFFETARTLRDIVQPVRFVPELVTGEQLLDHFRRTRSQIAIAVDEFGGMAGLVTLEDVIEHIVGDIHDPEDRLAAPEIQQVSDIEYEVSGRLSVRYWAQIFGRAELPERVATVAGLVTALLGRPARPGEAVRLGNVNMIVLATRGRRVDRVRVRLDEASIAGGSRLPV